MWAIMPASSSFLVASAVARAATNTEKACNHVGTSVICLLFLFSWSIDCTSTTWPAAADRVASSDLLAAVSTSSSVRSMYCHDLIFSTVRVDIGGIPSNSTVVPCFRLSFAKLPSSPLLNKEANSRDDPDPPCRSGITGRSGSGRVGVSSPGFGPIHKETPLTGNFL